MNFNGFELDHTTEVCTTLAEWISARVEGDGKTTSLWGHGLEDPQRILHLLYSTRRHPEWGGGIQWRCKVCHGLCDRSKERDSWLKTKVVEAQKLLARQEYHNSDCSQSHWPMSEEY